MSPSFNSLRVPGPAGSDPVQDTDGATCRWNDQVDCQIDPEARARLVAMSTMASAMAHELSQPLSAATNYIETGAQALRECFASIQQLAQTIENAGRQTARAIELVRRMRSFVMTGSVRKQPEQLASMVANAAASLGVPRDVALSTEIAPDTAIVNVERIHFEAVLANLLLNAMQATRGRPTRQIWLTASVQGGAIVIRVEDSGAGISEAVYPCLFEPLFTTRPDGTGLGLPICQTLVEAHGGTIWAEPPEAGRGAVFVLTVPR